MTDLTDVTEFLYLPPFAKDQDDNAIAANMETRSRQSGQSRRTDDVAPILAEAVEIVRIVKRLRDAEAASRPPGAQRGKLISAGDILASSILPRGEPKPTDTAAAAFEEAIRFWAQRVAPRLTYGAWDAMVWHVVDVVPDFPGDVVRFFENRFEMLRLKDGYLVLP